MSVFTGTGRLVRLALRRDRIKLPVWVLSIVGLMVAMVVALKESYVGIQEQAAYLNILDTSAVGRLFAGTPGDINIGSIIMGETTLYIGLAVVFMSTTLVIRHTRYNEELGSSELLQSARVGRYAALTSALVFAAVANIVVAAGLALTLQFADVVSTEQAWAYGVGQGLLGFSFAAIAGVAAQASDATRGANGLVAIAVGATFLLRGVGDIFATSNGSEYITPWFSWLSPFGWLQQARPLSDVQWWVYSIAVLFAIVGVLLSYALLSKRDVGSGLLPARKGPARASRRLLTASPLGLAWRLQKGVLAGWMIGTGLFALIVGSIADQMGELIETSEFFQQYLAALGGTTAAVESMLSAMLAIIMLVAVAYTIQAIGKARVEETSGRLESLLGASLGRVRWLSSHVSIVIAGTVGITALSGAIVAVTSGIVTGAPPNEWQLGAYTLAGLSYVPALLVFVGVAVFGLGLYPRFAMSVAWLAFTFVAIVSQLGVLLKLPERVMDLSPLSHIAAAPSEDIVWRPLVVLLAIAVGLIAAGLVLFRRRNSTAA